MKALVLFTCLSLPSQELTPVDDALARFFRWTAAVPVEVAVAREDAATARRFAREAAYWVPADCDLFVQLQAPVAAVFETGVPQDVRKLLETHVGLDSVALEIFEPRIALFARRFDYKRFDQDAPNDGADVLAWCVVLWMGSDRASAEFVDGRLREAFKNQVWLGLEGRDGEKGVYKNATSTGHHAWEFWHTDVPGTGHLAVLRDGSERLLLTNSFRLLAPVIRSVDPKRATLGRDVSFVGSVEHLPADSGGVVWFGARALEALGSRLTDRVDGVEAGPASGVLASIHREGNGLRLRAVVAR